MAIPSSISGFSVIPILYKNSATHCLYARSHAASKSHSAKILPQGRTLFLVNLPPDTTERELVLFFKHAGTVEKVIFDFDIKEPKDEESDSEEDEEMQDAEAAGGDEGPRKGRKTAKDKLEIPTAVSLPSKPLRHFHKTGFSAYVIFLDSSSLNRALASTSKPRAWPKSEEETSGLAHYRALYESLRPPLDAVQAFTDSTIEVYEYELAKKKQKSKYRRGEALVDEDGFTLVTRGGAYGKTLGGGVGVASKRFQRSGQTQTARNRSHKKEKKEKEGFYGFQKAEQQRSALLELKRKWEDDKAKVEKLKASRRFKPY
ncbi:ribosomal RNA-processing protein 7-domain-containing protein [Gymnopilus junonius]|uniref:Ribosomal RNA-processing protein 7-domain-containing protein n=1 Tax=Gymnopilus junonius TaxID=109634 RepID=A0A9P5NVF2_GYMJU|nr:ribosomal RNA-processing protein 7-domain-containing protein [Gymnopilus junonius]